MTRVMGEGNQGWDGSATKRPDSFVLLEGVCDVGFVTIWMEVGAVE